MVSILAVSADVKLRVGLALMGTLRSSLAVLQVADCGPLESLVSMFQAIGLRCGLPDDGLRVMLKKIGCDTVLSPQELTDRMGYDAPMELPLVSVADMAASGVIYVDVKAHRNGPLVWKQWPRLRGRTLWYRINGGKPEHVVRADGFDCGDEVNPPCPVLTPNQWYKGAKNSYTCWPPFYRIADYQYAREKKYASPLCLIHNVDGWGYKDLVPVMRELGVRCYGVGAPDGLLNHANIPARLSSALAMVHLKSSDAPGYAICEAMAAGCPVVCTRRLIWRCKMQELLIPGKTCLVFDRETHDALSQQDILECREEVGEHLQRLHDPIYNRQIGDAGRDQLSRVMWDAEKDANSLEQFLVRHYG